VLFAAPWLDFPVAYRAIPDGASLAIGGFMGVGPAGSSTRRPFWHERSHRDRGRYRVPA
jgi:hypothetical protein